MKLKIYNDNLIFLMFEHSSISFVVLNTLFSDRLLYCFIYLYGITGISGKLSDIMVIFSFALIITA